MQLMDLINARQSVRGYLDRPVEREKIEACLEAARLAPSASNTQPWRFIVVDDPGLKETVARGTFGKVVSFNHFTLQAPVLVAVLSEQRRLYTRIGGLLKDRPFSLIDIGIAAEHFCLRATELGLGTCMLGWFDERVVKKLLGVPRFRRVDLLITLGYPADSTVRSKKRRSLEDIRSFNRYAGESE